MTVTSPSVTSPISGRTSPFALGSCGRGPRARGTHSPDSWGSDPDDRFPAAHRWLGLPSAPVCAEWGAKCGSPRRPGVRVPLHRIRVLPPQDPQARLREGCRVLRRSLRSCPRSLGSSREPATSPGISSPETQSGNNTLMPPSSRASHRKLGLRSFHNRPVAAAAGPTPSGKSCTALPELRSEVRGCPLTTDPSGSVRSRGLPRPVPWRPD